jgi:hypothetical protein
MIFLAIAYPAVPVIAFVVLHYVRLHYVRLAGTEAGFDTDRDNAKLVALFSLMPLAAPACLLSLAGIAKLVLIIMDRLEARRPPPAR